MLPQRLKKAVTDNPKKVANLIDINVLRDFLGQSRSSQLTCFKRVWSYVKENNLQDPVNKNVVNCYSKLRSILLGKSKIDQVAISKEAQVIAGKLKKELH
ncbi:hypothetical protein OROMI_026252 [Orobanche minor]